MKLHLGEMVGMAVTYPPDCVVQPMVSQLFHSFFQGGFECSTQRLRAGRRLDVIDATAHDRFAEQDYSRLKEIGMQTARDGFRWHLIEHTPGEYDFRSVLPMLRAARHTGMQIIWDLCHYGWPDFVDVFSPEFPEQFGRYAAACAAVIAQEAVLAQGGPNAVPFVCPINEISFLTWAGGDVGYLNPFAHGRGLELKMQLVRAALRATDALRRVLPNVRIVYAEPLLSSRCHPHRLHEEALAQAEHLGQYQTLDMLSGRLYPELGGYAEALDIVGLNYYPYNQWIFHPFAHEREHVPAGHPLHRPLSDLLGEVHTRYGRPLWLSETGTEGEARPEWLRGVTDEVRRAREQGVPVEGVCLYPILNHAGWDDDRPCPNGLWDGCGPRGERHIYAPLLHELRAQGLEG
ncbi:beta-glucosidase [Deinococcus sp. Arct2-2]|uniref:beta-glucosidase n=1 Tax=Deinococcus sp. Arct2-2 TaxID=2568653 RepID=UPI0010A47AB4|nr:beta-glucosidase [Deinococcus sp. Arct2-2]THF71736.1 beta-glucosidase [Deinococcus sp. Arct2-2]